MGKINIKGGVWRNTEDEILKAAVMKYGKNQWARIASLLHRKSAKQCKARWYEWLDPSVKKTEWSREEDEKLLHLSKLMPTQWRTIAPIVGRTANQCLERYEFLLDKAQNLDGSIKDDVRRLRPGEIDPTPETKPARPDPVDMDEDELEMLSEARARLANTQGKKAKRKARERQLEIARRMALMQKRRELRAAGLGSRANLLSNKNMKVRIWGVDYNHEIPFEKQPPKGFYDTSTEHSEAKKHDFDNLKLQDVEKMSYMEREKLERKKDAEKLKKKAENDLPGALIARDKMANEPLMKRSKLVLPSPQIDDGELENLIKIKKQALVADMSASQSNEVNGGLDVSNTPGPAKSVDFRLTNEDDPSIEAPGSIRMSSYRGNALGNRSERSTLIGSQRSLLRNDDGESLGGETPAMIKMKKSQLASSLSQLPTPKNDFEIFIPEDEKNGDDAKDDDNDIDDEGKAKSIMDQADLDMETEAKRREREQAEWKTRSQALQRSLPRPIEINNNILRNVGNLTDLQKAEELIKSEMLKMLHYDAMKNPPAQLLANLQRPNSEGKVLGPLGIQKKLQQLSNSHEAYFKDKKYETFDEEHLSTALKMIDDEIEVVKTQIGHGDLSFDAYKKVWNECLSQVLYLPAHKRFTRASIASKKDRIDSAEKLLLTYRQLMTEEAKKAAKMEKKLRVLLGGYQSRSQNLIKAFQETVDQLEQTAIEYESLNRLKEQETRAIYHRLDILKEDVERQKERESKLQLVYGALMRIKEEGKEKYLGHNNDQAENQTTDQMENEKIPISDFEVCETAHNNDDDPSETKGQWTSETMPTETTAVS